MEGQYKTFKKEMESHREALKKKTKHLALRIIRLFRSLPKTDEARFMGRQLLRCGTSVAAGYRALCRARPGVERDAKIEAVVERADEIVFWMELLVESEVMDSSRTGEILNEAKELLGIFMAMQGATTAARSARGRSIPSMIH